MFQNYLVEYNNGPLYAYRNYNLSQHAYWYNPTTTTVYIWTGQTWSTKYETSEGRWTAPLVQAGLPSDPFIGMLVFNTTTNELLYWDGFVWTNKTVYISTSDETLQTNWRHGLNNEQFIPAQVDWFQRSYPEYENQYNTFIAQTTDQLIQSNPTLSLSQAQQEANTEWTTIQQRWINPAWYTDTTTPQAITNGPLWIGNWQIKDIG